MRGLSISEGHGTGIGRAVLFAFFGWTWCGSSVYGYQIERTLLRWEVGFRCCSGLKVMVIYHALWLTELQYDPSEEYISQLHREKQVARFLTHVVKAEASKSSTAVFHV